MPVPAELDSIREAARRALGPVRPADHKTQAEMTFLFDAKRTEAGRKLPPYYLVYFLLVELLGFKDLGHFEKIDWSVPIDFKGKAFLIEHRKFGLGVFARDPETDEWPAPGSEDTKFGVTMGPEVGHGASEVYAGVQA